MYDFDTLRPRLGLGSEKWDQVKQDGPEPIVPLTVADMEFRTAPEIVSAVEEMARFGLWGYTHDDDSFRQAVAGWMLTRHGWQIEKRWLVATPGVVPALYTAVRALTSPGDGIIIQPPVYPPFYHAVEGNGRKLMENTLVFRDGRYQMDFEDLAEKARQARMLILCSPHNPVGRVWRREELATLAEICRENDVIVVSDEIHSDIILPGHRHTPYGTLPENLRKRCVIATSASKSFSLAGLSCSSIIIEDEELRRAFRAQRDRDGTYFNSTFGWVATRAAYGQGAPWLEEMIQYVDGNYRYLEQYIAEADLPLTLYPLEGTYLAWIDCRAMGLAPDALEQFLTQSAGLYVNQGHTFGTEGAGFIRLNLACPRSVLVEAMERLDGAWKNQDTSE